MKKSYTFKLYILLFITVSMLWIPACQDNTRSKKPELKTYKVEPENVHKTLYFTGIIQPLKESTLTNSMNAVIVKMHYHFGQHVKKGDVVFTLNSSELQKQYNDTLTEYLKAKDAYTIAQSKFVGTNDLWQAGLLSKNNYLSEKSSLNNARITLIQATRKLSEMLERIGNNTEQNLSALSLSQVDKVRQALTSKHNLIFLRSPGKGVLLYPPETTTTEDKSKKISVGASVKADQVLALIGDLSGVRVEIDIPEVDIDKVRPGMPALVSTVAFPNDVMQGELVAVNAQASTKGSNVSLPSFTAIVIVKQLSEQQKNWIKVGMSASVALPINNKNLLLVPTAAIEQKEGKSFVMIKNKDGKISSQIVKTGAVQDNKVIIESGLKSGDQIEYLE